MKLVLSSLFLLLQMAAFAQFKEIAKSNAFEEPESGFARIVQLKNGNTAFIVVTQKEGVDVRLYDDKHKEIFNRKLNPRYGKLQRPEVEGVFEVNGDIVCLIQELDGTTPKLNRLVIDGTKGTLKQEDVLGELDRVNMGRMYSMAYGGVPWPTFYVKKDPDSDNYGIVLFNSFESDRNKRVEIVTYKPNHEVSARAYLTSPNERYKYLNYLDMAFVNGDALIFGYGFNTKSSGGRENNMLVGSLKAGSQKMEVKEVAFTHNLEVHTAVTKFNKVTGNFLVLMFIPEKKGNTGDIWMVNFDPKSMEVVNKEEMYFQGPDAEAKAIFGSRSGFRGTPVNLFVHKDGSYSVALEEISVKASGQGAGTNYTALLGSLVIANFDVNGKFEKFFYLPKEHYHFTPVASQVPEEFYHHYRENGAWPLKNGNQYNAFVYLRHDNQEYVLYNDYAENRENIAKGKLKGVKFVSDCDAYLFPLKEKPVPVGEYLFGVPAKKEHNLALFSISAYNQEKNQYVTLRLVNEGKKSVQLVWMEI